MPSTINADNGVSSGSAGLKSAADSSGVLQLQTNGTTAVTVDTSQNVGVGITAPTGFGSVNLHMNGTSPVIHMTTPTSGTTSADGMQIGYSTVDFDMVNWEVGRIGFWTSGAERMRIDSSGNVGIGTSAPTDKLQVKKGTNQNLLFGAASTLSSGCKIESINDAYTANVGFEFRGSDFAWISTGSERMRIDSSGNLLVGTTSISNNSKVTVSFAGGSGASRGLGMVSGSTAGTAMASFNNPNGYVGEILTTGSSTAYNTSSDYRLKENVQPMTGALAKVAALKPCTYTWKADGSAGEGFIAHELAEVVPGCVSGEKDAVNEDGSIKPQGIDTSFLVATLTAAIQELKAEVDSLKSQLAAKG